MADLNQLCETVLGQRPLILASNRGPVEHQMSPGGRPEARRGSGSIVTALNALTQTAEFTWVASAMGEGDRLISGNGRGDSLKSPLPGHQINLRYVVTPRRVYHKYYNVLCNPLLWFLQHYMWNPPYNPNGVTIRPAAIEMTNAANWLTRPSPIVSLVKTSSDSAIVHPFSNTPTAKPPTMLISVMMIPAMASPRTNLAAPSIAP